MTNQARGNHRTNRDNLSITVAMYLRQSLDQFGDELAIDRQREDCLREVARRWPGSTISEYPDNSVSATKKKPRPQYTAMLADIESGKIEGVVVYDLDRLHRQPRELEDFIDLAERHHLLLATVAGETDLSTTSGRLHARLMGVVARHEMERKAARQRREHEQRAQRGVPWCPVRPFGYRVVKDEHNRVAGLCQHETEAPLVREAYADLLAGATVTGVVDRWNAAGVRTTRNMAWSRKTLRDLLLHERNVGRRMHHGDVAHAEAWEPLVDEDVFDAVVGLIKSRKGVRGRRSLLSGIAGCGVCGRKLDGNSSGTRKPEYRCLCGKISRNAERLDALIGGVVVERLSRPDAADLLLGKGPDQADLREKRRMTKCKLDELEDAYWQDGAVSKAVYLRNKAALEGTISDLDAVVQDHDTATVLGWAAHSTDLETDWAELPLDRQRAVVTTLMTFVVKPTRKGARLTRDDVEVAALV